MNRLSGSRVHVHMTIVFDWKMMAAIGFSILILLRVR